MSSSLDKTHDDWPQVAKLTPEELLQFKNTASDIEMLRREWDILDSQKEALKAKADAIGNAMWLSVIKNHSLPAVGKYFITYDGYVRRKPNRYVETAEEEETAESDPGIAQ